METRKEYINRMFKEARMKGLCFSQGEFARLLGMNQSTISNALNGSEKYLTDNFIKRVQAWEEQVLRKDDSAPAPAPAPAQIARPDIIVPAETMDLYTSMAKSIENLTELVKMLQPKDEDIFSPGHKYTTKNYLAEK